MIYPVIHRRAIGKRRKKGARLVKTLCGRLVEPNEAPTKGEVECKSCQKSLHKRVIDLYENAIRENKKSQRK